MSPDATVCVPLQTKFCSGPADPSDTDAVGLKDADPVELTVILGLILLEGLVLMLTLGLAEIEGESLIVGVMLGLGGNGCA